MSTRPVSSSVVLRYNDGVDSRSARIEKPLKHSFLSIQEALTAFASEFDAEFSKLLAPNGDVPEPLRQAVHYAALGPGKRIRPYLTIRCCELLGGVRQQAWPVAAAVECIHAFSLIHDDLPAMDDDDLRRGRPTVHKKFNEAIAILAGDALAILPFELIPQYVAAPPTAIAIVQELAAAAGWSGMIGGQAADILGEGGPANLDQAVYIHERKTAALFRAACRVGALCAAPKNPHVESLASFGLHLGKAFQITDDLLDVLATGEETGKKTGKDSIAGKQTYPRCVGIDESRRLAADAIATAIECLSALNTPVDDLRALARFVVDRTY